MKNTLIGIVIACLISTPCFAVSWNEKLCPDGIQNINQLIAMNPYDVEGKCFGYMGPNAQLLKRTKALFGFYTDKSPFALIDFGKESAPMGIFSGIVKGKRPFVYQTVSGSVRTIFSFVNIPQSNKSIEYQTRMKAQKLEEESRDQEYQKEKERIAAAEKHRREKAELVKAKEDGENRAREEFHRKRIDEFGPVGYKIE